MPRTARKRSESGIYHVVLRGINKQTIFFDDEDREVFLNRLKITKEINPFKIYAFCLMSNHIHILIQEESESISRIFLKILSSYVFWYNRKYERTGNLFQDRYKSEVIDNESYLLCAARYIHQNPMKAGVVKTIEEYKWSSYDAYMNDKKSLIDVDFILSVLGGTINYIKFMNLKDDKSFLEYENRIAITDGKLSELIEKIKKEYKIDEILKLERGVRNEILSMIRQIPGTSIRQISRIIGVPISIIRYIK